MQLWEGLNVARTSRQYSCICSLFSFLCVHCSFLTVSSGGLHAVWCLNTFPLSSWCGMFSSYNMHGSSNIVGLQIECGMPTEIPPSKLVSTFSPNSFAIETNLKRICYRWVTDLRCTSSDLTAIFPGFILPLWIKRLFELIQPTF